MSATDDALQLKFRDPGRGRHLVDALAAATLRVDHAPVSVMHVCGSHEQAISRFGLRSVLPGALNVVMGPGCPVCVTDPGEIDECIALALQGVRIATYGDMLRVPGRSLSLAGAQARGAKVHPIYTVSQAVDLARRHDDELVFFASGFETTAVATAAAVLGGLPPNMSILSTHKYVPPAMELVARTPDRQVEGFLAAGHAATITGYGIFEKMAERHGLPIVVAGFEPLDILAGLVRLVDLIGARQARAVNMYPRCVTRSGNERALAMLFRVFELTDGHWRGIARVRAGDLRLRREFAQLDARNRFTIDLSCLDSAPRPPEADQCLCGPIMSGKASPSDCALFGKECRPDSPVGACMVSSEGTCRIWSEYGGHPDLGVTA